MFSVTIYRNDTPAESRGQIKFKVKGYEEAQQVVNSLSEKDLPPMIGWQDVDGKIIFFPSTSIAKVEIQEDK